MWTRKSGNPTSSRCQEETTTLLYSPGVDLARAPLPFRSSGHREGELNRSQRNLPNVLADHSREAVGLLVVLLVLRGDDLQRAQTNQTALVVAQQDGDEDLRNRQRLPRLRKRHKTLEQEINGRCSDPVARPRSDSHRALAECEAGQRFHGRPQQKQEKTNGVAHQQEPRLARPPENSLFFLVAHLWFDRFLLKINWRLRFLANVELGNKI